MVTTRGLTQVVNRAKHQDTPLHISVDKVLMYLTVAAAVAAAVTVEEEVMEFLMLSVKMVKVMVQVRQEGMAAAVHIMVALEQVVFVFLNGKSNPWHEKMYYLNYAFT